MFFSRLSVVLAEPRNSRSLAHLPSCQWYLSLSAAKLVSLLLRLCKSRLKTKPNVRPVSWKFAAEIFRLGLWSSDLQGWVVTKLGICYQVQRWRGTERYVVKLSDRLTSQRLTTAILSKVFAFSQSAHKLRWRRVYITPTTHLLVWRLLTLRRWLATKYTANLPLQTFLCKTMRRFWLLKNQVIVPSLWFDIFNRANLYAELGGQNVLQFHLHNKILPV